MSEEKYKYQLNGQEPYYFTKEELIEYHRELGAKNGVVYNEETLRGAIEKVILRLPLFSKNKSWLSITANS